MSRFDKLYVTVWGINALVQAWATGHNISLLLNGEGHGDWFAIALSGTAMAASVFVIVLRVRSA